MPRPSAPADHHLVSVTNGGSNVDEGSNVEAILPGFESCTSVIIAAVMLMPVVLSGGGVFLKEGNVQPSS